MPNQGSIPLKETNNHKGGREGSGTPKIGGPVHPGKRNPTSGGGINRPTKGKS
jgi:hypothetical protein